MKEAVKNFWDAAPCGTRDVTEQEGTREYFTALEKRRYQLEPFIDRFAQFERWAGKDVLEVGCGPGIDLVKFAKAGARVWGLDLSGGSLQLARRWLRISGLSAQFREGDAERLPFGDNKFDFVYSWGVLHHTPCTGQAVREVHRVLKPGGESCVMVYHKHSLFALQVWLFYGLLRGKPWSSIDDLLSNHVESPGTKAFTRKEAKDLFGSFDDVVIETVVTPYDVRVSPRSFLPAPVRKLFPSNLGWFLVIRGRRK